MAQTTVGKQLDELFIMHMLEIDDRYKCMAKSDRLKIEQWVSSCSLI
jgi:hypothetical protein